MATFKAEVYQHQKRQDGTWNIKIRVTHNKRKKYLATSWYVTKDDITRTYKIKNQQYVDYTDDLIKSYRRICDRQGERLKSMTVEQVVSLIERGEDTEHFDLDIVDYARKHIARLRAAGNVGNANTYEVAINNLVKFVGRDRVSIKEITSHFVKDWIAWINAQPAPPKRAKGSRAQSLYPSQLRAIHNMAKREFNDEDSGIIRIPLSPFRNVDIPKVETARKRAITPGQLLDIWRLPDSEIYQVGQNRRNLARDVYVISFLLIGMNEADLFECRDCKDGRITYQRKKTRNRRQDRAEISINIEPELEPYLKKYRDPSGERVFCFHRWYSNVGTFTAAVNKGLKMIGSELGIEDLEFYSARHTWATIAINDAEIDKYTVHTALNHVDERMKVTDTYIKKSWKPIDKANRKVLDFLARTAEK
ncbi:MAG: tyrosine-type recombinase/integrase [Candidatus Cryptobacteroides sp.]